MNRVVITGIGAVTPFGNDIAALWEGIKTGRNTIGTIEAFDTTEYKVHLAAECKAFNVEDFIDKREARRMDRFCHLAMVSADEAIADSGLDMDAIDKTRAGCIYGCGIGGFHTIESEHEKLMNEGPNRISPFFVPMIIINMAPGLIAIKYGLKGMCSTAVTACATGTNAIGDAFRQIKHGYADIMVTGGAESAITKLSLSGFSSMKALSTCEDKDRASIPFDAERSGFVMGEGAGTLVLESLEHAQKRGAKIYGEIVGYGSTCDAYHITMPDQEGEGAKRAMEQAVEEAGIAKERVSYINAHGTSTPPNDKFETMAIKKAFGDHAYKMPVSSTKSMIGHLLGAAGAVEAIICTLSINNSFVPATIGLKTKDPECDLDYVPNAGREQDVDYALSNSFGFGGHNATLLFAKFRN